MMFLKTILVGALITFMPAVGSAEPEGTGLKQFDQMSTLLGAWEGEKEGKILRVWYRLIAGGTVFVSTIKVGDDPEMVSIYHLDHGDLMMTHYGKTGSHPRLRAKRWKKPKESTIRFEFQDITNLKDPQDGHMRAMTFKFKSEKRFTATLLWREKGKEEKHKYVLKRPKE